MALAATTVWDVRTTGSNTNGGGYDSVLGDAGSGVDYTQQDAAQESYTTLATAGAGVTTLTCSGADTFDAGIEGNILYIASGTNVIAGWYQATARASSTSITIDRAPDDGGGGIASGVGNMGGCVAHPEAIRGDVVAGNKIYIETGTYTQLDANDYILTAGVAGGNGTPIIWEGWAASRGDAPTGATRPLFDGDSSEAKGIVCGVAGNLFRYIRITKCTTTGIDSDNAGSAFVWVQSNSNDGSGGDGGDGQFFFCEFGGNTGAGYDTTASGDTNFTYCYSHNNGGNGFAKRNSGGTLGCWYCISANNTGGYGFYNQGNTTAMFHNVAYKNSGATGDGFYWSEDGSDLTPSFIGNVAFTNGRYGFNRAGTSDRYPPIFDYNSYNGNVTDGLNNITAGDNDNTDAPNFTDGDNGDFTVNSGSPLIGNGPATIPGATGDYKINIGVDQDDNTAAGSGGGWLSGE